MRRIVALIKMGRPLILPAALPPYTLGLAIAYYERGSIDWPRALMGLALTLSANLVAHYADEYADVDTDALTQRTWFSGGSGVLPSGIVPRAWALRAAFFFLFLTIALAAGWMASGSLTVHAGWIVAVGLWGGWFYSMPPLAFERRGLGEIVNALLGAVLMPLMGYTTQTGTPSLLVVVCVPIFLIVMVNLLGVHWADRRADAAAGRLSLVLLMGRWVRALHVALTALTYLSAVIFVCAVLPVQVSAAILATLPAGIWAVATFTRQDSPVPSSAAMVIVILAASIGWIGAEG